MNTSDKEQETIEAAAAGWLARRDRRFTAEEAVAFARWRMADRRHAAAVAELELVWGALEDLSVANGQERAGDVAAASPTPVLPLSAGNSSRTWWRPALGLAAAVVLVAGALRWQRPRPVVETTLRYETQVGNQWKIALADGSQVHLNTDTVVAMHFSAGERRVVLERGEAFFDVAKDTARPFVVAAGRTQARALGTAFLVRLRERESEVTVTEGKVKFGAGDTAAELRLGESAVLPLTGAIAPRVQTLAPEEVARRLAWRQGRLEFKDTPLRDVVAEFNRYHRQRLVPRDAATAAVPVGGPFNLGNLAGFVRLLEASCDVVVVSRDQDKIVLGLRP